MTPKQTEETLDDIRRRVHEEEQGGAFGDLEDEEDDLEGRDWDK